MTASIPPDNAEVGEIKAYWDHSESLKENCPEFSLLKLIETCLQAHVKNSNHDIPSIDKLIRWIKANESILVSTENANATGIRTLASIMKFLQDLENRLGEKRPLEKRVNLKCLDYETMLALENIIAQYLKVKAYSEQTTFHKGRLARIYGDFAAHHPDNRVSCKWSKVDKEYQNIIGPSNNP